MGAYETIGGTPQHDPTADRSEVCDICSVHPLKCICPPCPTCQAIGCVEHAPMRMKSYPRAREECLTNGTHLWGEGALTGVCLRCGEGATLLKST
jgi:hypothetical protein